MLLKNVFKANCFINQWRYGTKSKLKICVTRSMSRFSANNNIMVGSDIFRFSDYDCIGFDLDSTLCHYNITNHVRLIYGILSRFLVETKKYDSTFLAQPFEKDLDIMQKGLTLDLRNGNIVKLDDDGFVYKVCHGSRMLSEEEVLNTYGHNRNWEHAAGYVKDMLDSWNGPRSLEIRALLDYYDMPSSVCFSRCVDTLNKQGSREDYRIWPDILDGLLYMFSREHYAIDKGEYFVAVKNNPELYYRKCESSVIEWLKEMRKQKKTIFVITGSNVDFANHTGTYCMGPQWKELFDVVVYYSRKPGFFIGDRPFYSIKEHKEIGPIAPCDMKLGNGVGYSQGNWTELHKVFQKHLGIDNPKCLYVGDNLLQDIYTPSHTKLCDTVTINEEMTAEGMVGQAGAHPDAAILNSERWGSYYSVQDVAGVKIPSLWGDIIRKHSKICIPSIGAISKLPLDHEFLTFSENKFCTAGFYPGPPLNIVP